MKRKYLVAMVLVCMLLCTFGCSNGSDKNDVIPAPTDSVVEPTITEAVAPTNVDADTSVTATPTESVEPTQAEEPLTLNAYFKTFPKYDENYAEFVEVVADDYTRPIVAYSYSSEDVPTDAEVYEGLNREVVESDKYVENDKTSGFDDEDFVKVNIDYKDTGDVVTDILKIKDIRTFLNEKDLTLNTAYEIDEYTTITLRTGLDYTGRTFESMTDEDFQNEYSTDKVSALALYRDSLEKARLTMPLENTMNVTGYINLVYKVGENVPDDVKNLWVEAYKGEYADNADGFAEFLQSAKDYKKENDGIDISDDEALEMYYNLDILGYGACAKFMKDFSVPALDTADEERLTKAYCAAYEVSSVDLDDATWKYMKDLYAISLYLRKQEGIKVNVVS